MAYTIFETELYSILNELGGSILDNNKIKEKFNLENIDCYITINDAHIFIKYDWNDIKINIKVLDNFIEDCNKINSNSLKLVISEFKIDYSSNHFKLISEKSLYYTLKKIDNFIQSYISLLYYSNLKYEPINYII